MIPLRTIREINDQHYYASLLRMVEEAHTTPATHPDQGAESHEWWDAERGCLREKNDG